MSRWRVEMSAWASAFVYVDIDEDALLTEFSEEERDSEEAEYFLKEAAVEQAFQERLRPPGLCAHCSGSIGLGDWDIPEVYSYTERVDE